MEFERRKRRHSHIDIAPLVDVVFLLLLFFMLTFNMAMDQAIEIEAIPAVIRQHPEWSPDTPVNIRADQNVSVGLLVRVIDGIRNSGSRHFNVLTEKRQ